MSDLIRKVEEDVYDGSSGEKVDTHVRYELGGEIDGTWVPFASVRESFVGHLQRLDQQAKEKAAASSPTPTTTEPTTGES